MNLATIERMLAEGDLSLDALRYLVECHGECEWLDYKEHLSLEDEKGLCDFTKDVLAMKNVGGGYIVVGVRDKTWEPVGLADELPYDSKLLADKVHKCCGIRLDIYIVHHELYISGSRKTFGLIYVRSSKKRSKRRAPTLVNKDFAPKKKHGLRRGDIFARKTDSTVKVTSQEELIELIDNLEARTEEEAIQNEGIASPFAVIDGLYRLLEKGYNVFIGREDLCNNVYESVIKDPRIWIVNVHGPGGVGKSAVVNWVTYKLYEERRFEAIIHLSAKETALTPTGIRPHSRSLYSLENLLDHILLTFEEDISIELEKKKQLAVEWLSAYKTLLVLDNMETVSDGRILDFLRSLPPESKSKVLLTSRRTTGGWELAIPVPELNHEETRDFLVAKSQEMKVDFPINTKTCKQVRDVTGGLPLAIQWIVGRYKLDPNIKSVMRIMRSPDSPVLEFSFRNIWERLSQDAQSILAVITIFESPPTIQQISIATSWTYEKIEKALGELAEVTLITRHTQQADGSVVYSALPITTSFARHQFSRMGEFEVQCRQRFQKFNEQIELQQSEVHRFVGIFERYGLNSNNEKKAAILCRRGQSEMFSGNTDTADVLFKQARDTAPRSAYVYAMCASYELARNRVGLAKTYAEKACKFANKKTGALCYAIMARVLDVQRDRNGRVAALEKAIKYDSNDVKLLHQYGVALSLAGNPEKAVEIFTSIIDREKTRKPLRETIIMALKTRIINLRRLGRSTEAASDLRWAKTILAGNPHLQHQIRHIEALEES